DQDHVREAVGDVDVPVRVDLADVAEGLPALGGAARGGADVAVRRRDLRPPAHPDLAFLADRDRDSSGVPYLDLADHRPADRTPVLEPLGPADQRHGLELGAAVELDDYLRAEPVDPGLLE